MAGLPPNVLEFALPAAAGLVYALIWYATRGLPRLAQVLARALPLVIILPAVFYVSVYVPLQRERIAQSSPPPDGGMRRAPQVDEPSQRVEPAPKPAPPPAEVTEAPPPPPAPARAPRSAPKDTETSTEAPPPDVPAAPQAEWDVVPVFYGTDRARKDQPKRIAYSSDRARRLELGRALVTVPKAHQVPNIERPFAIRVPYFQITIYEQAEDPKQHFTVRELKDLPQEEFLKLVRERIGGGRAFKDQTVVFVHG